MVRSKVSSLARPKTDGLATIKCLDRRGALLATLEVPRGIVLLDALEGIRFVLGQCGGTGGCGNCAVELEDGRRVLACCIRVEEDMTVRKLGFGREAGCTGSPTPTAGLPH